MNVRKSAWELLCKCESHGQYSNLALDAEIRRNNFSPSDRALLTAITYGVLERKETLDYWISKLANRSPEPEIRVLLRIGLYQLAYLDRVPDHAAVDETVGLAPKKATGFVNAVLRSFQRSGKQIPLPDSRDDPARYIAVRHSVSPELARRFLDTFGMERTEQILQACDEKPSVCLRTNTLRISSEKLRTLLAEHGYDPVPFGKTGLRLYGNVPVSSLPGFREGYFFVQDEASQRCVAALDARPGMSVLDVCSCPGSKSFGAAADMENRGQILAFDLHKSKLSLVVSGAERLGIAILTAVQRDARQPLPEWCGKADRVICDVPCSGYGVLAKKPELRYKNPAETAALPEIQSAILEQSSTLLKPGGKLVYSTCTILPEENDRVVDRFLASHPSFCESGRVSLFPDTDHTDGFFYSVLQRN